MSRFSFFYLLFLLPIALKTSHSPWSSQVSLDSLALVCEINVPFRKIVIPCYLTGANREIKKAVEAYWAGKISADELTKAAADVKKASWTNVKAANVDLIPRFVRITHRD
jgi:hypothetical protein